MSRIGDAAIPLLLCASLLAQHTLVETFAGVWFGGWIVLSVFAALAASVAVASAGRALWAVTPLLSYLILSGVLVGIGGYGYPTAGTSPWPIGQVPNMAIHTPARLFASSALVGVFMIALLLFLSRRQAACLRGFLADGGILVAASIIVQAVFYGKDVSWQVWAFDNPSMAASFCVLGALSHTEWLIKKSALLPKIRAIGIALIWILMAAMLAMVKASTPILAAAAGILYLFLEGRPTKQIALALSLLTAAAVFFFPSYETIEADASGRLAHWITMYEYWASDATRMLFGTGLGTSKIVLPILTGTGLFWAHSDWYQIAFELGLIGLACALLAAGRVLLGLVRQRDMIAVFLAFAVLMAFNFPIHSPAHALWLIPIIKRSI